MVGTIDLLELTSLDKLILIMKMLFTFVTKQGSLQYTSLYWQVYISSFLNW